MSEAKSGVGTLISLQAFVERPPPDFIRATICHLWQATSPMTKNVIYASGVIYGAGLKPCVPRTAWRAAPSRDPCGRNPIWSGRRSPPIPTMRVSVVVVVVIVAQVIRRGSAPRVGLVADPDRMRTRPEFLLLVQRGDGIAGEGNRVSARGCG